MPFINGPSPSPSPSPELDTHYGPPRATIKPLGYARRHNHASSRHNRLAAMGNPDDRYHQLSQLHLGPEAPADDASSNVSRSPSDRISSFFRRVGGSSQSAESKHPQHPAWSSSWWSASLPPQPQPPAPRFPPPSYEEATTAAPASPRPVKDDQYAFLSEFNTIFLIDDSYSMKGERWRETQRAIEAVLPVCVAHDADGVDVYFLNHRTADGGDAARGAAATGYRNVRSAGEVMALFAGVRPRQATPTGTRLDAILRSYLGRYEAAARETGDAYCLRPINVIVVTDGQPTDEPGEIIALAARRLDAAGAPPHQVGVQFFQVGADPAATAALRDLDDDLCRREGVRDMVDTVTFDAARRLTGQGILKVVLGAVKRKLDRVDLATRERSGSASASDSANGTSRRQSRGG
ncbi:hypothetical protein GGS23DRAFT_494788 [Durotheca rogersii]|uniref:uncharacterized protein n=1 Tax=Durotheca rogersii TaxID=419775 RepID=UPI00221FC7A2|nr:uncharacterized protein GGS23DRAFT_494788 [Durotheca rogersii]KAI5864337.1 hypothetical protein GGS23DRAFT_494788 [Durotheca rogersii]